MALDTLYTTPTLSELISRIEDDYEARLPGEGAKLRRSFLYVTSRVFAGVLWGLYGFAKWQSRQLIYDTIDDLETMKKVASVWGIAYLSGTAATSTFGFTGTESTLIPAGTVVALANGVEYTTDANGTISGGSVQIAVTASEVGVDGNIADPAEVLELVNPIAGINSTVSQMVATEGGTDEEGLAGLKERVLDRIRATPQGGAEADYVAWAKGTAGTTATVDRVWVTTPADGEVNVKFTIEGSGVAIFPPAGDITLVAAEIENDDANGYAQNRPVTAEITVEAPDQDAIPFTISLNPNDSDTQDAVEAELEALFVRESSPGGTIKNSDILAAIAAADGVDHWSLDAVDGGAGTADIIAGTSDELPYLGTVTWNTAP